LYEHQNTQGALFSVKLPSLVRLGALFAAVALAGCGGNAAPASSAAAPAVSSAAAKPSAAASVPASAKPAASAAASAKPAASGAAAASAKPTASGSAAGGAAAKPQLPSACPAPSPAASAAAKPAASGAAAPASAAAKPAAKPTFVTPAGILGQAAPGPYTEKARATVPSGTPTNILVRQLAFTTNTLVVKAGDTVNLTFTNCDTFAHNFISPSLKADPATDIPAAASSTAVSFTAPTQPGTYMFWCSVQPVGALTHAERGMTGEVIVQ
jgi:plastocyanin